MNRIIAFSLILFAASLLLSCKNTEAELYSYEVCMEETSTIIDHQNETIEVVFPDHIKKADQVAADFILSDGADAFVNNTLQISGESKNNYQAPFTMTIVSEDGLVSVPWKVHSRNNDYTITWGMGGFLQEELSLDRPYEWYIDQSQTGWLSDYNCAPSCVVMAATWQDSSCTHTVEEARSMHRPSGGGWLTYDIGECLTEFNTEHLVISLSDYRSETLEILMDHLQNGNIILVAIDIYYLDYSPEPGLRINKYYETTQLGTGHCIILKGYVKVDGVTYFEVYDPIGYDFRYSDGSFKGKDRYYLSDDVYSAAFAAWNYAFVIQKPNNRISSARAVKITDTPNILVL